MRRLYWLGDLVLLVVFTIFSQGHRAGGAVPTGGLRLRHEHIRVAYQGHRQGLQAAAERCGHALLLPSTDDALARGERVQKVNSASE